MMLNWLKQSSNNNKQKESKEELKTKNENKEKQTTPQKNKKPDVSIKQEQKLEKHSKSENNYQKQESTTKLNSNSRLANGNSPSKKPSQQSSSKAKAYLDDEDDDDDSDDDDEIIEVKKKVASKSKKPVKKVIESPEKKTPPKKSDSAKKNAGSKYYAAYMRREGPKNPGSKPIPIGKKECFSGLTFLITGVLDSMQRDECKSIIEKYGGRVVTTISKKLDYLVVGDDAGQAKLDKASQLNIKQVDEDEFLKLICTKSGITNPKYENSDAAIDMDDECVELKEEPKKSPVKKSQADSKKNTNGGVVGSSKFKNLNKVDDSDEEDKLMSEMISTNGIGNGESKVKPIAKQEKENIHGMFLLFFFLFFFII
jgi:replication factor C subunit 1